MAHWGCSSELGLQFKSRIVIAYLAFFHNYLCLDCVRLVAESDGRDLGEFALGSGAIGTGLKGQKPDTGVLLLPGEFRIPSEDLLVWQRSTRNRGDCD